MHFLAVAGESSSSQLRKIGGNSFDYATPIKYSADYRKVELENGSFSDDEDSKENDETSESSVDMESDDDEDEDEEDNDQIVQNDKYLIFTMGFKTYTPHQIGAFAIAVN